jgi:hypothetical protein
MNSPQITEFLFIDLQKVSNGATNQQTDENKNEADDG